MNIAIVDDIEADRQELSDYLDTYMKSQHLAYTLFEFSSGEDFLSDLISGKYQLVFMDIYMDGISGIEAARKLRQCDQLCKLIFLTTTEDYARHGYGLRASYYLVKPLRDCEEDFCQAMELCQFKSPYDVPTLSVSVGKNMVQLDTGQILYIDFQYRYVYIHLSSQALKVKGTFLDVTAPLQHDKRFLNCYRGILVNLEHVKAIDNDCFLLDNQERIPIARRNMGQIRNQYHQYVLSEIGGAI